MATGSKNRERKEDPLPLFVFIRLGGHWGSFEALKNPTAL
jgi:hypothetical protein